MSDAIEAKLDDLAAKVAALEEEVANLGKRFRKLRRRVVTGERDGEGGAGQPKPAED